jgi:hypothetical protein
MSVNWPALGGQPRQIEAKPDAPSVARTAECDLHPADSPLVTPPPTDTKPSKPTNKASCIIRHLHLRKAGFDPLDQPWAVFQLLPSDFEQLIALLKADESLWGFIEDKVRYGHLSRAASISAC